MPRNARPFAALLTGFTLMAGGSTVIAQPSLAQSSSPLPAPSSTLTPPPFSAQPGLPQPSRPAPAASVDSGGIRGVTQCFKDLSLGFPVAGRLAELPVAEGDEVAAGAELASLDQQIERLEVERRKLVWENGAEIRAATARADTAAKQATAARSIFSANGGISREELENKELAHALASAEVQRLRNAKNIERIDFLTAQENLARRTLRAPRSGVVTKIVKNVGESIQANDTAVRLCDNSRILFQANVPVAAVAALMTAPTTGLLVAVGPDTVAVDGRVVFVSPVVDAASGLTEVKIELQAQPGSGIRPGLQARLQMSR